MLHRFLKALLLQKIKKTEAESIHHRLIFCRRNLSLASCSSAELASVSIQQCKIQNQKLYLQLVKKASHFPNKDPLNPINIRRLMSYQKYSGNCVKNNPAVFKPKEKPWIHPENSSSKEIMETINKCPSGALSYRKD